MQGLVAANDIPGFSGDVLREAGDVADERFVHLPTGGWLLDGRPIDEVRELLGKEEKMDSGEYETLSGFLTARLGRVPQGERSEADTAVLEVRAMACLRVAKLKVTTA